MKNYQKNVDINEIKEFLKLNEGCNFYLNLNAYGENGEIKEIPMERLTYKEDENYIYINDFAVSVEHIAHFYPTNKWGSWVRIALYTDEKNSYNEINLRNNMGKGIPFKLTPYIEKMMKDKV